MPTDNKLAIKKFNIIDFTKLFFAICVVGIHSGLATALPDKANWYVMQLIFRMAVPFFFVTSGYFVGRKLCNSSGKSERVTICRIYVRKLVVPLLFWGSIGLIFYAIPLVTNGEKMIALRVIQCALFYPQGAMWFVLACIVAVCIIVLLWNHKGLLAIIGGGGYVFALLCNTYYFLVEGTILQAPIDIYMKVFINARNGIFIGVIFIGMGVWLSNNSNLIKRWKTSTVFVLFLILYAVLFAEVVYTYGKNMLDSGTLYATMPFLATIMLELCKRIGVNASEKMSLAARSLSVGIYFTHRNIISLITIIAPKMNSICLFFMAIFLAVVIWIITRQSKSKFIRSVLP